MNAMDHLKRAIGPLERRVRTMLMRGSLTAIDDSQDLQVFQVTRLEDEVLDGCEHLGQWGLASMPPAGSEVIVGQIGSNADHQVVLGVNDRSRPRLTPGQTCVYDGFGTKVLLDGAGNVTITTTAQVSINASAVQITAPTVTVIGDLNVVGLLNGHAP